MMSIPMRVFIALLVLSISFVEGGRRQTPLDIDDAVTISDSAASHYQHPSWLHLCTSIYLDVGSNIGVQVRKLYEPEKFPGALILPLFQKKFGQAEQRQKNGTESGICALGFEPNPNHRSQLKEVQDELQKKGYFVHFYPYAVSGSDGNATFQVSDSTEHQDWGAKVVSLLQKTHARNITVQKIDFYRFLQELPKESHIKLMKMDVEGAEWDTLARLIPQNELCDDHIEEAFIEIHSWGDISKWKGNRSFDVLKQRLTQQKCNGSPTIMSQIDDETYLDGVHLQDQDSKTDSFLARIWKAMR
eukprot:TRINITY_DN896_c0_g1_i1.p1 TRINITY_DN896_c0_g1~~TRINITY_DN896_c0_g1_i1.p1  ORF type:complete len:302 (+),score=58.65 TRINITY_DN896_c0_g1_i1:91-996(+)